MGNKNSKATGKSRSAEQGSAHSKGTASRRRINAQMVQNVLLIWLDNNIDDGNTDCRNTITQLRRTVNDINRFTDAEECIQFLDDITDNKACMIISGSLGQHFVPRVHNMSQVDSIFIFCGNKKRHEQWTKEWSKIKGVFTEISPICEALKQAAQQCEQNAISISFMGTSADLSNKNLNQLDPTFMYTQILKEILLTIKFEQKHIQEFIDHCRAVFVENEHELKNVDKLQQKYRDKTPIWWYTYECFLYPMLNRALRLTDVDIIIKMGFFIGDLHRHIEQLHSEQFNGHHTGDSFTVYRGQGMSKTDFKQMTKMKGGLLSFNNFLSTSKDHDVSFKFARLALPNSDMVGILFVMTIDPTVLTTPFASIVDVSFYKDAENEVLFSMNTVFRIGEIKSMDKNDRLFQVDLTLTSDNDKDLRLLTDRIREETFPNEKGWQRLGLLLNRMGYSAKSQQVYEIQLGQTTNDSEKGNTYERLGIAKCEQGDYKAALEFYEKSFQIRQETLPPNHPHLAASYNNIGMVYNRLGEYPKALSSYEKALHIQQQSLPSNHPDLGSSYINIGLVYYNMGEYPKAFSYYEKDLAISQKSLPPNHPDLAASYNNIGNVYYSVGEYPKALSFYEKAFEIRQQSLPPNHPDLGSSYYNIGETYRCMNEYPKALSSYEKSLQVKQQSLPPNHPNLASTYNNIGLVYYKMDEYPKALSYYEKAFEIRQQSLPSNHPDLGSSYNNIGDTHRCMGEYPKALSSYEKSLEIKQQSLPPNHPDLGSSYNNIGGMYRCMGEYPKALSSYEKSLEIKQQSLPPNHLNLASTYNNIGHVYYSMNEFPKALSSYEKSLEIKQKSLPPNHPDLAGSYNNIGAMYNNMGNYLKACSFYERALEIGQHSLPSNHPNLQLWRKNLENVKRKL
jgi:tetratricopeptide (TPR) repeat protein